MNVNDCSEHYLAVVEFMRQARQLPAESTGPTVPSPEVRLLRARLIWEESLETIAALGVSVTLGGADVSAAELVADGECDLVEVADGCADIAVVTTGTLVACGIPDQHLQRLVDENNLAKFGNGHSYDSCGKLLKPPGHRPPDIAGWLQELAGGNS